MKSKILMVSKWFPTKRSARHIAGKRVNSLLTKMHALVDLAGRLIFLLSLTVLYVYGINSRLLTCLVRYSFTLKISLM